MDPGSHVGHYRIVSRIGSGGMGEVYLAHDEHLDRPTALKVLGATAMADPDSLRRFTTEARAAAALNHPNIAHIYDAGQQDGVPYLVMEYVEGATLNTIQERLPLSATEILRIGMQVADALIDAQRKGIIHRDIKPSNLIQTTRGDIKILDFGLAKLISNKTGGYTTTIADSAPTASNPEGASSPEIAIGSLPYMSPEQALAREVDSRTDIFSLGAVLYELATGRRAFPGHAPAAVFDAILNRVPAAPRSINQSLPEALDRIIRKCLEKDASLRYQTALDLLADLRLTERDTYAVSSPTTTTGPFARSRRRAYSVVAIAAVTVLGSAILGWRAANPKVEVPATPARTVPLTSFPGSESQPSFSPDGNQVAFSWNEGKEDDFDLYVKVVEAGSPLRLTNTPALELSPAWSPDGKYIAFIRQSTDKAGFYLIPALGGLERKLSDASPQRVGADAPYISWAPDGKKMVVVDRESESSSLALFLLDVETNNRRRVTSPPEKSLGDSSVVFGPDGTSVAFIRTGSLSIQDIYIVNLRDGKERRLTFDNRRIFGITWNHADGRIIFSSARSAASRLWRVAPSGGPPQAMPGVADQAGFLGMSRTGQRLAFTRSVLDTNIWKFQVPDTQIPVPVGHVMMASTRHEQGPRYSPDGTRIVFASNRSGSLEIWVADSTGENPIQLTTFNGPPTGSPMWSPDGKFIVFDSRPAGNPDIYVIPSDGGQPRRLTSDVTQEILPSWSRDGKWIYFASNRTGRFELFKVPVQGGNIVQVTRDGGYHGVEDPDGKLVYYAKSQTAPGLWRVPVGDAKEEPVVEALKPAFWSYWSFGRNGIYWVDREDQEGGGARYPLHFFDLAKSRDTVMTTLSKRPFNSGLSVSPDGKWFLYTQVDQSETDIMMVDGFR
ncbi:MAG: serine/threonine-protein kinase [Acidobacteria bacterium]|nr:serine/threonine-protein kinase [Acidobacteriota bacterium]